MNPQAIPTPPATNATNQPPEPPKKVANLPALAHQFVNLLGEWQVTFQDPDNPSTTHSLVFKEKEEADLFRRHEDLRLVIVRLEKWIAVMKNFTKFVVVNEVRDKYQPLVRSLGLCASKLLEARHRQMPPARIAAYIKAFACPDVEKGRPGDRSTFINAWLKLNYLLEWYIHRYQHDTQNLDPWQGKYPV